MLKCIGSKCYYHFSSDIYCKCDLVKNYVLPGNKCLGIEQIDSKKSNIEFNLSILERNIEICNKEWNILEHLKEHIEDNQ